jgi:hypothetical protein
VFGLQSYSSFSSMKLLNKDALRRSIKKVRSDIFILEIVEKE